MVADSVPLQTSRGRITLPDYLKASGNTVYFTTRELTSLQEKVLAEGRDVPAVDASWFSVPSFLEQYAKYRSGIKLVRLDDDLNSILRPVGREKYRQLIEMCEELGFSVSVDSFRPTEMPALMTYPAEAEIVRNASTAIRQGLIPEGFSSLMRDYVAEKQAASVDVGTLHLNASCPLIERLATSEISFARKQSALAVIAYFAKLFCGRMLDAPQAISEIAAWRKSFEQLI